MKEIQLTKGYVTIIDDDMWDRVNYFKWSAHLQKRKYKQLKFYAYTSMRIKGKVTSFMMHQLIYGFPNSHIDHADNNGLNNQKHNLRPCTRSQNAANKGKDLFKSSVYKGVSWHKDLNKWQSRITLNGNVFLLGYFRHEIFAATAYNTAAIELFGEFAKLNIISQEEIDFINLPIAKNEQMIIRNRCILNDFNYLKDKHDLNIHQIAQILSDKYLFSCKKVVVRLLRSLIIDSINNPST